ncbi:MAG: hypothetical protein ACFFAQ_12310 [Promethearchaeota archaeon]
MKFSKKLMLFFIISLFIIPILFQVTLLNLVNTSIDFNEHKNVSLSTEEFYTEEWLVNNNFTTNASWFSDIGSLGDPTDVNATISGGQANFLILGNKRSFSNINGTPQSGDWDPMKRAEDSIYPDRYEINEFGCNASHEYWEGSGDNLYGYPGNQTRNRPSVLWKRLVEMPIDMSDYLITSAEVISIFNGSANINVETPNDTLTGINPTRAENDHTKFYVQLTNLEDKIRYEIASYEPVYLGNGSLDASTNYGSIDNINDTVMIAVPLDVLNYYLNRVFEYDHRNFTIILGIDIDCEDNYGQSDRDTYYSLLIKICNLTFDYEKKINQLSSVSWNQICKRISDISNETVIVIGANLNFKYKVNQTWPELSPNSEIQILINDNKHTETVKLSSATTSPQDAKSGGFDITSLITDNVNFSLQVSIADDFALNDTISVSIDDISLVLSYIIIIPDEPIEEGFDWMWLIYILIGAMAGLITIIILYQTHFKYPPLVRKIKKLRKKVRKSKKTKPIIVNKREKIVRSNFQNQIKNLDIELTQMKK